MWNCFDTEPTMAGDDYAAVTPHDLRMGDRRPRAGDSSVLLRPRGAARSIAHSRPDLG